LVLRNSTAHPPYDTPSVVPVPLCVFGLLNEENDFGIAIAGGLGGAILRIRIASHPR
jgi:hypothetical protein